MFGYPIGFLHMILDMVTTYKWLNGLQYGTEERVSHTTLLKGNGDLEFSQSIAPDLYKPEV